MKNKADNFREMTDSQGKRFVLKIDYKNHCKLWRVGLHKIGIFKLLNFVASVDLVENFKPQSHEVRLDYINFSKTDPSQSDETDEFIWNAVKQLAQQERWSKIYGWLTLEQIENHPKCLFWLKNRGFAFESQSNQESFDFSLNLELYK